MTDPKTHSFHFYHGGTLHTVDIEFNSAFASGHPKRLDEFAKRALATHEHPPTLSDEPLPTDNKLYAHINTALTSEVREREEQLRQQQRDAFLAERDRWIAEHGSEPLQQAATLGMEITGSYARERAAHDIPGWIVHTRDWRRSREDGYEPNGPQPRHNPSMLAMELYEYVITVQNLDPERVGLVWYPRVTGELSGEALSYRDYLGKYQAYLFVEELQASFLQQLQSIYAMMSSGVPILHILKSLGQASFQPFVRERFLAVHERVANGEDISDAFGAVFTSLFPTPAWEILRAGESSGDLSSSFDRLTELLRIEYQFAGQRLRSSHWQD